MKKKEKDLFESNRKLENLASMDALTGLANRRIFDEHMNRIWQLQSRTGTELSLIICEIDFFKNYNDYYGHQAGDDCLKQVAEGLRQSVKRATDLIAWYGGEEFIIVLPDTEKPDALNVAQRIHQNIERLNIVHAESKIASNLTLSIGVSSVVPNHDHQPDTLIKKSR